METAPVIKSASSDLFGDMLSFLPWVIIMVFAFCIWWATDAIVKKKRIRYGTDFLKLYPYLSQSNTHASWWNMFSKLKARLTRSCITTIKRCWKYMGILKRSRSQSCARPYSACSSDTRSQRTWDWFFGKTYSHSC